MNRARDMTERDAVLSALVPRVVLRAPFVSKELGPLRYLSTHAGGATVALFDSGVALHFHGDVRALASAFARLAELEDRVSVSALDPHPDQAPR